MFGFPCEQFSQRDADNFDKYEEFLGKVREVVQPLLDNPPPKFEGSMYERLRSAATMKELIKVGVQNREVLVPFYELFTGAAFRSHVRLPPAA